MGTYKAIIKNKTLSEALKRSEKIQAHIKKLQQDKIGKPLSEETRKKISMALKGRTLSKEHRANLSKAQRNENHPSWKGGISKTKEGKAQYRNKRRSLKYLNGGTFTALEWTQLKEKYGNKCALCGVGESEKGLTVDHIIPLSRGGDNFIQNIQPLCHSCNNKKATKVFRIKPTGEFLLF